MGREGERMKGGGREEGWKGRGEQVFVQLQVKSQFISIFHNNFFDEHDLWIKKTTQSCILALISHTHIFICVLFFRFDIFPVSKY